MIKADLADYRNNAPRYDSDSVPHNSSDMDVSAPKNPPSA